VTGTQVATGIASETTIDVQGVLIDERPRNVADMGVEIKNRMTRIGERGIEMAEEIVTIGRGKGKTPSRRDLQDI
jgi:hypothetical protein